MGLWRSDMFVKLRDELWRLEWSLGRAILKNNTKFRNHKLFKTWKGMINRCYNLNLHSFPLYGGRGIYVCERWEKFENFISDMKDKPFDNFTLDRKDPDGPYSPENCEWASRKGQMVTMRPDKKKQVKAIHNSVMRRAFYRG
jgi:hypothetical protein